MNALAEEVRGYRADLNGRLRKLEQEDAARAAREKVEEEQGTKRLRRRDIYVPLTITQVAFIAATAAAIIYSH